MSPLFHDECATKSKPRKKGPLTHFGGGGGGIDKYKPLLRWLVLVGFLKLCVFVYI